MVQWVGIGLLMQGTQVRSLVQNSDPCASTEQLNLCTQLLKPSCLELVLHKRSHHNEKLHTVTKSSSHLLQLEKAHLQQQRSSATKNKFKK